MTDLSIPQPDPVPTDETPVHDLVVDDVIDRKDFGFGKYATFLQASNGRDALVDAYQEMLDMACYMRLLIQQRRSLRASPDYRRGLAVAHDLMAMTLHGPVPLLTVADMAAALINADALLQEKE